MRKNQEQNSKRIRSEIRRKKRLRHRLFVILISFLFVGLFFYIKEIKGQLREMQSDLIKAKNLQYKEDTYIVDTEEEDYISSIPNIEVDKPIQRTREEAIEKLREFGQKNSKIQEICENDRLYPDNMLVALANNPEMADFVGGYLYRNESELLHKLTQKEIEKPFPLFLQWDPRWGYEAYGSNNNIGVAGCGPTCMSMVLFYLTKDPSLTPDKIAKDSLANNYYIEGTGTAWIMMEEIPKEYGIHVTKLGLDRRAIETELDQGKVIICAMGKGDFTMAGHFIVIYGYDEQGLLINDPNCVARSRRRWSFDEIESQIKNIWSYGQK